MPDDDRWSVATGEIDDKPMIMRIRNQAPTYACQADFPQYIIVQWKYQPVNEHGMPSPEVVERMGQFEELLDNALEGASQAFLAIISTGSGVREWQWYARDSQATMKLVNAALAGRERFPVEFIVADDPSWQTYERFRAISAA